MREVNVLVWQGQAGPGHVHGDLELHGLARLDGHLPPPLVHDPQPDLLAELLPLLGLLRLPPLGLLLRVAAPQRLLLSALLRGLLRGLLRALPRLLLGLLLRLPLGPLPRLLLGLLRIQARLAALPHGLLGRDALLLVELLLPLGVPHPPPLRRRRLALALLRQQPGLLLGPGPQLAPGLGLLAQLRLRRGLLPLLVQREAALSVPRFALQTEIGLRERARGLVGDVLARILGRQATASAPTPAGETKYFFRLMTLHNGLEVMARGLQREADPLKPSFAHPPIRSLFTQLRSVLVRTGVVIRYVDAEVPLHQGRRIADVSRTFMAPRSRC
mmetsp:Transcript_109768/g.321363  ORF Transcript_109768/g.321363 Transcript_109768/m.321363 type:complete len:330 (+) Transcript_109768:436-1425(+)